MDQASTILGEDSKPLTPPGSDEKTLGLLAHLITLVSSFIGPIIIYLVKKDDSEFVANHAKESLNFQITMLLAYIVCFILMFVIIGVFLMGLIGIIDLVLVIVAAVKASEGKNYRYPFCIRLIK